MHRNLRLTLMCFVPCLATSPAFAQQRGPNEPLSEARTPASIKADHLESFDTVWQIVPERYWSDDFDSEMWNAARDELRPKLADATDIIEFREITQNLLGRLALSHYSIIPGDIYSEFDGSEGAGDDWESGLSIRVIDDNAYVIEVSETSDAHAQGVRCGWQVTTVGGSDVGKLVGGLAESLQEGSAYRFDTLSALLIESQLRGNSDEALSVTFKDAKGVKHELEVKLHAPEGIRAKFGYVPVQYVRAESKEIAGGIGYVRFNRFFAPEKVLREVVTAIELSEKGLIIDLRGNIGGLGPMTMGIGSRLIEWSGAATEPQFLGIQRMKGAELKYVLTPGASPYDGPVAVLIDECSVSSAEILAAGLQALGRARLFGNTSAGAALPAIVIKLANGDYLQFAVADFEDSRGRRIEGMGVVPDEPVPLTKADLQNGVDRVLQTAISWIESEDQ